MKTEKEALACLEVTDAELIKADAEATAELSSVQATVAEHSAALAEFRRTGHGILAANEARAFIESLDRLLFANQQATTAATADAQRETFFRFQRARLAGEARELYLRSHAESLANALETIITHRSRNRDKWRTMMANAVQSLERKQLLNEPMTIEETRKLEALDRALGTADSTFAEASNALLKFRAQPTSEHLNDARRFATALNFEGDAA